MENPMIRISQLKLPAGHSKTELYHKAAKALHIKSEQIASLQIRRQSIDARKKPDIFLIYVVDITLNGISEQNCVSRSKNKDVSIVTERPYQFPKPGTKALRRRPVIIGSGPAGLFCCYMLAQNGYRPILLERGKDVEARKKDVEAFWNGGPLNPESNVSFGEGGAGTFSDGKLNTLIKDKDGRGRHVLSIFVENGAQPEILYDAKPHIGTDVLSNVVKQMRKKIIQLDGEVRFESRVETFRTENGALTGVILSDGSVIDTETAVLAIGHSARDTFFKLYESGLHMEAKAFAVGLRVEHPQELINQSQYGTLHPDSLGAAPYKVTARTSGGRGVYSFCMCPGGECLFRSRTAGGKRHELQRQKRCKCKQCNHCFRYACRLRFGRTTRRNRISAQAGRKGIFCRMWENPGRALRRFFGYRNDRTYPDGICPCNQGTVDVCRRQKRAAGQPVGSVY